MIEIDIDDERTEGALEEIGHDGGHHDDEPIVTTNTIFHDAFPGRAMPIIMDPDDGLPRPDDARGQLVAPPLSVETFVCMEDDSEFVEVFVDDGLPRPATDTFAAVSKWSDDGKPAMPRIFKEAVERYGVLCAAQDGQPLLTIGKQLIAVRPKRPQCKHLVTRINVDTSIDNQGKPATPVMRFCSAFKTVGGAYFSLMDENIIACTHRDPPDPATQALVRQKEREKVAQGKERTHLPMFNLRPPTDWAAKAKEFDYAPGVFFGYRIFSPAAYESSRSKLNMENVRYILFPDPAWQPPDDYILQGHEEWKNGRGHEILRSGITRPRPEEDAGWPKNAGQILGLQIIKEAAAMAKAMADGQGVIIVSGDLAIARFAACAALASSDDDDAVATEAETVWYGSDFPPAWKRLLAQIHEKTLARAKESKT